MAESLLKDAQRQIRNQEGEINSVIEDSQNTRGKSFFGLDERAVVSGPDLKKGKTCQALKISSQKGREPEFQKVVNTALASLQGFKACLSLKKSMVTMARKQF
ncbi:MAG: hypothetical protein HRU43_00055 [Simkaniaceae bacterium]|nr:hypothetical protein [Simkaniaceae bacterium]